LLGGLAAGGFLRGIGFGRRGRGSLLLWYRRRLFLGLLGRFGLFLGRGALFGGYLKGGQVVAGLCCDGYPCADLDCFGTVLDLEFVLAMA